MVCEINLKNYIFYFIKSKIKLYIACIPIFFFSFFFCEAFALDSETEVTPLKVGGIYAVINRHDLG